MKSQIKFLTAAVIASMAFATACNNNTDNNPNGIHLIRVFLCLGSNFILLHHDTFRLICRNFPHILYAILILLGSLRSRFRCDKIT